ncbi:hypothetical protein VNO80_10192 [Phaseolus coccineus]|uniref:Uncharacterized protein n=1 Tax=Phaseolus coccineus TaxID=3886 RepID=A0AAN9NCZ9_PHACN
MTDRITSPPVSSCELVLSEETKRLMASSFLLLELLPLLLLLLCNFFFCHITCINLLALKAHCIDFNMDEIYASAASLCIASCWMTGVSLILAITDVSLILAITDVSLILAISHPGDLSSPLCVTRTHRFALVTDVTSSHPAEGSSTHYSKSVVSLPHGSVTSAVSPARGLVGPNPSCVNACSLRINLLCHSIAFRIYPACMAYLGFKSRLDTRDSRDSLWILTPTMPTSTMPTSHSCADIRGLATTQAPRLELELVSAKSLTARPVDLRGTAVRLSDGTRTVLRGDISPYFP